MGLLDQIIGGAMHGRGGVAEVVNQATPSGQLPSDHKLHRIEGT